MNIAGPESGERIGRRSFLTTLASTAGALFLAEAWRPQAVYAATAGPAAVRLSEITILVTKDSSGNTISERKGVEPGNHYVLSPMQERGRERIQRVLVSIGEDGVGREKIRVVYKDGSHSWRDGGDTFVFSGVKDTEAPVHNSCHPCESGFIENKPGIKIDVFRVRKGGVLEYFLTFPTAFNCNPRNQRVIDTITEVQKSPPKPTPTPEPTPPPTRPVPAPVQIPRSSSEPSLSYEFGDVAVVAQNELGRTEYE